MRTLADLLQEVTSRMAWAQRPSVGGVEWVQPPLVTHGMIEPRATPKGPGRLDVVGAPLGLFQVYAEVTAPGDLGSAKIRVSTNPVGYPDLQPEQVLPPDGIVQLPGTGLLLRFSPGPDPAVPSFEKGDLYTFPAIPGRRVMPYLEGRKNAEANEPGPPRLVWILGDWKALGTEGMAKVGGNPRAMLLRKPEVRAHLWAADLRQAERLYDRFCNAVIETANFAVEIGDATPSDELIETEGLRLIVPVTFRVRTEREQAELRTVEQIALDTTWRALP